MLQQTTVGAVRKANRYEKFLAEFPDIETLAQASEQQILKAWEGLGYYQRVRNLQATAREILKSHCGEFPKTLEGLRSLPGIGPYTSAAIMAFAYEKPAPLLDANITRVLTRLTDDHRLVELAATKQKLEQLALQISSKDKPREHHNAIMELGQHICTNKKPLCAKCPVRPFCTTKTPEKLPHTKPKKAITPKVEHTLLVITSKKEILLSPSLTRLHRGLWKLPKRNEEQTKNLPLLSTSKYQITRYNVTLHIYKCSPEQLSKLTSSSTSQETYHPLDALQNLPLPSPYRRALTSLLAAVST